MFVVFALAERKNDKRKRGSTVSPFDITAIG
jgi:hypothetical protein